MRNRHNALMVLSIVVLSCLSVAKDTPPTVMVWPSEQQPVVRFTFGKFRQIASRNGERLYETDVKAENLWGKPIPDATFSVDFVGKDKSRIGSGWIGLSRVGVGETVKFKMNFSTVDEPARFTIVATSVPAELRAAAPAKAVSITVYSSPSGAILKVDGQEIGETPKRVDLTVGKHKLEFSKQGFSTGTFPLEIGPNDVSGGTVNFELGAAAHDTLELRDGTMLTGDLESVTATEVLVRVSGSVQTIDRNNIRRILLIQREKPVQ